MKYLNSKASTVGVFFAAAALLVFYLLSIRWQVYLPVTLFWVAVALMLGTIVYQILKIELSSSNAKVVLLEIAVTCFVFHLIYVIPYYGLAGYDPYFDLTSTKAIQSSGFIQIISNFGNNISNFPMIHILGAILSMISSIDLFSVAKWFSPLVGAAVIPLLYLLVRSIFKEEKVALFSALLFACVQNQIYFSSLFIRETLALVLAVCCFYLYFSAKHSLHPAANYVLSIMCLIGTVFAHHLTSFMLLIFFLVHFIVTKASDVPFLRRTYFDGKIMGEKVTSKYILIASVALFAFWVFVANYPLEVLTSQIRSLVTPGQYGAWSYAAISGMHSPFSITTIRGHIIFYGFYSFLVISCLILLYGISPRRKNRRVETYSFTLFLLLCLFLGFLSLYVIPGSAYPDRFLTYGWLFGSPPLVLAILKAKHKCLRGIGVLLLVSFMLFNIFMIDPAYWNAKNAQTLGRTAPTLEDYALANTFNFSTGTILGPDENVVAAIYDVHNNLGTIVTYNKVINVTNFGWVIINKPELEVEKSQYPDSKTISLLEQLAFESSPDWSKIYESNNLVVVKVAGS